MKTVYSIEHKTKDDSKAVGIFSDIELALGFLEAMMRDDLLFSPDSSFIISKAQIGGSNDN